MRQIIAIASAIVVVASMTTAFLPRAHAATYGNCYSMVLEHGFRKHWLEISPGILIQAAYETCRRLLMRV